MNAEFELLVLGDRSAAWFRDAVGLVEALAYDQLWHADEKFFRDGFVSLALAAEHTERLRLGIAVTEPYARHPALTAMTAATLADIAPGRIEIGLGAGGSGFQALGIQRQRPVTAVREAVELMRQLWAGEHVAYTGDVVRFESGALDFHPHESIPVAIASSSRLLLQLAGEIGDAAIIGDYAAGPGLDRAVQAVTVGRERVGRPAKEVHLIARLNVAIADDSKAAIKVMKPWVATPLWNRFGNWQSLLNYEPTWEEELAELKQVITDQRNVTRNVMDTAWMKQYLHLLPDNFVLERCLAGTATEVRDQVQAVFARGINRLMIYPMPLPRQSFAQVIRQFAEMVMTPIRQQ